MIRFGDAIRVINMAPFNGATRVRLESVSSHLKIEHRQQGDQANIDAIIDPTVEVIIGYRVPIDLSRTPSLRWIQLVSAGVDHLLKNPPWARGLMVTNARGVFAVQMAEYVMSGLLQAYQNVNIRRQYQAARRWPSHAATSPLMGRLVRGRTMVIVGYGGVGREVARVASAMGMRVIAVKRRPEVRSEGGFRLPGTGDPEGLFPAQFLGPKDLNAAAALADVLVVTMPLTSQTLGLIDESVFAALPPRAWLINVARGKIVDEDALVSALRERRLTGAILDVFREQPLPQESPLWDMPNVIISPHIAGGGDDGWEIFAELAIENMRRYVEGAALLNRVDGGQEY
jgi:phosphoglycerate dehydrogenase-like enzyme